MDLKNILSMMALMLLALLPTSGQAQVPEDYPYGPMLKEGYTWHYWYAPFSYEYYRTKGYTLSFKGKSVVEGHECVNCYFDGEYDDVRSLFACMFVDEDQRIWAYVYNDPGFNNLQGANDDLEMPLLIFDPNDMKGFVDSWEKKYWSDLYTYEGCDEIEVEGKIVRRHILNQSLNKNKGYFVEGIGIDGDYGDLIIPFVVKGYPFDLHTNGLDRVTNPAGETIYKGNAYHEKGDVNSDGLVDVDDVRDMLTLLIDGGTLNLQRWGDLNDDEINDVTDLTILLDIILGNKPETSTATNE